MKCLADEHITHSCSCVGMHPQNSRSCRCHSWGLQCCRGISCTLHSVCRKHPCLTCLCCCCTGTAGSALLAERGYHSNLGHIPHIGHLNWEKKQIGLRTSYNEKGGKRTTNIFAISVDEALYSISNAVFNAGCLKQQEAGNV